MSRSGVLYNQAPKPVDPNKIESQDRLVPSYHGPAHIPPHNLPPVSIINQQHASELSGVYPQKGPFPQPHTRPQPPNKQFSEAFQSPAQLVAPAIHRSQRDPFSTFSQHQQMPSSDLLSSLLEREGDQLIRNNIFYENKLTPGLDPLHPNKFHLSSARNSASSITKELDSIASLDQMKQFAATEYLKLTSPLKRGLLRD